MGIIIESTALSGDPASHSSVELAGQAGRDCIAAAGLSPRDVDLLINVGIFRDRNRCEPGLAAMIQRIVGMNLDYCDGAHAATSFDLMNSACGALNAVQVASGFLLTGSARRVLIVSSDVHPANRRVEGFPYANIGAAMLVRAEDGDGRGFGPLATASTGVAYAGVRAHVPPVDAAHQVLNVEIDADYAARALALATSLARDYVDRERVDLRETLLVTTHPTPTFAAVLARGLGVDEGAVVTPQGLDGDPHSSALTWGYHVAHARGLDASVRNVLFVAAGAGLSAACAVYRR